MDIGGLSGQFRGLVSLGWDEMQIRSFVPRLYTVLTSSSHPIADPSHLPRQG